MKVKSNEFIALAQTALADEEQRAAVASVTYRIEDLAGLTLASADGYVVTIDDDGAGQGWFVDQTPDADEEFAGAPGVDAGSPWAMPHDSVDLDGGTLRDARLNLIQATRQVIANGLRLLGVSAPESM